MAQAKGTSSLALRGRWRSIRRTSVGPSMTESSTHPSTWLSAFPKSGSTWLRFLVRHLLHGPATSSSEVEADLPSLHEERPLSPLRRKRGRLILTHKTWEAQRALRIPTAGFVQLIRHPVDVVLSDMRYFLLTQFDSYLRNKGLDSRTMQEHANELAGTFLTHLLQNKDTPKQRQLGFGSWSENVESWLEVRQDYPHVVVRYEDLRSDPVAQLGRVAFFLGLNPDREALESATSACSIKAMRQLQEREIRNRRQGRFYHPRHRVAYEAGLRFVNEGHVGSAAAFGPEVLDRLQELFGETMAKLGYGIKDSQCTVDPLDPLDSFDAIDPFLETRWSGLQAS